MDKIAIVISCFALVASILSVVYTARNARANERRLRGETDAPRSTRFDLQMPGKMVHGRRDIDKPWKHNVRATNAGGADARDVELFVTSSKDKLPRVETRELVPPGNCVSVSVGEFTGRRTFVAKVSWKDGRLLRQSYKRTLQAR